MKLSDLVIDVLASSGAKDIFLLPGGGCMHLCDSVGKRDDLRYVCCLHEQACAFAAEAYGEIGDRIGVCLVTSGPGGTNALTGVACAWIEGSPCLFISGQAKRADLIGDSGLRSKGPQEIDIVGMVKPVTKYAVRILDKQSILFELKKAIHLARSGRPGPVWLDIPLDIQASEIEREHLIDFQPPQHALVSLERDLKRILETLKKAKAPVLYVGAGVRRSGQLEVFRNLAEKLKIPTLLTWKAADYLDHRDPHYVGRPGGIGQRAANFVQQKCDWLLVLGARLDLPSVAFDYDNFARSATKFIVDVDIAEISKFSIKFEAAICADLAEFLPQFAEASETEPLPDFSDWLATCQSLVKRFPPVPPELWEKSDYISTYVLVDLLSTLANENDLIVPGSSGPCSDILFQAWKVKRGQRIINAPGLGAMGTGIPATIGVAVGSPRQRVINLNGDGGFQLNIQELETIRRLNLPVKFFVLDNNGYRSIAAMQRNHFKGRLVASEPNSGLTMPNIGRIAKAYDIPSFYVASHAEIKQTVEKCMSHDGPVVCVVKIDRDEATSPRCVSQLKDDGKIATRPMEDMWPFLDREMIAEIMGGRKME